LGPTAEELWEKAHKYLQDENREKAAQYFYTVFKRFPDDVNAAASLWATAQIRRDFALDEKDADWERVRNLFRLYINYFPKEENAAEAYLELGKSYYFMGLSREAVSYFKLFANKFPDSPLTLESRRWLGEALVKIGRVDEAEAIFKDLISDPDKEVQLIGFISMGELHFSKQEYRQAKDYFQMVIINSPDYYLKDPEILRKAGFANIRYGKIVRGRRQLYHYLNLAATNRHRLEVLFEIGESYLTQQDFASAKKLYAQVVEEGEKKEKEVLFSKLRMAQFFDNPEQKFSKWQQANDLTKTEGDKPYLDVLSNYFNDPLAQDARYGLFLRYKARGDLDQALPTGRDYLRNTNPQTDQSGSSERIGTILLYLTDELLKNKRYQDIYDLYFVEYRHVQEYPDGTILYRIGQALEALNLFEKASIVYYRAMKWPLTDEEKLDLYYRRARVYLALQDYESANRLLKHLRKIYAGSVSAGEIFFYSGQLYEALKDKEKALGFYIQAAEKPTFKEKLPVYAGEALRVLLLMHQEDTAYDLLLKMRTQGLDAAVTQDWFLKVGNAMRLKGQLDSAVEVYNAGLKEWYPQASNQAQAMHLYLGDCYLGLGNKEKGLAQYAQAKEGESEFWGKMAQERLNQNELNSGIKAIKNVSNQ